MREIKFRGKRLDNGEWVYGFYLQIWVGTRFKYIIHKEYDEFEVAQETLGQYIGLKDKNGKEIYEGDIVCGVIPELYVEEHLIGVVKFNEGAFYYFIEFNREPGLIKRAGFCSFINYEILGNIHDNPELIEVEE